VGSPQQKPEEKTYVSLQCEAFDKGWNPVMPRTEQAEQSRAGDWK
jgi:hypothetical protein